MHAYRETFRRHRLRYLLPAVIVAIAVGVLSYKAPTYMSAASLWVDNQSSSTSSLNVTPGSNQGVTPSSAEQTVLNELLTTASFQDAVLADAGFRNPANATALLGQVTSSTPGPQVLEVTDVGSSPTVAHNIVKSVLNQLQKFSQKWAREFAASAVAYYQAQVNSANRAVTQAKAGSGPSQNAALGAATSALATASSGLSQAQAQANGNNGFATVMVLGQPTSGGAPMTGYKKLLETAVGAGMAVLLLSGLVIVMLTPGREDKWDEEMSDPTSTAAEWAPPRSATEPGPVGLAAPEAPPAPAMLPSDRHGSALSHPIRRSEVKLRRHVTHQPSDAESNAAVAEG